MGKYLLFVAFFVVSFVTLGQKVITSKSPVGSYQIEGSSYKPGDFLHYPYIDEPRVALIIGNESYAEDALKNPGNDARAMAILLHDKGFDTIQVINGDKPTMIKAMREFSEKITHGVGLFYYAGHGLQLEGENYLVPIGADIKIKADISGACVKANYVLKIMEEANNRMNIVILDACRNNPYRSVFRSLDRGITRMEAPTSSIVAFATSPGKTAEDGDGENGLYTSVLLKYMKKPNVELLKIFKNVRGEVAARSGNTQVPEDWNKLTEDFYFTYQPRKEDTSGQD